MSRRLNLAAAALVVFAMAGSGGAARAQATSRPCSGQDGEVPGPACLIGQTELGHLSRPEVYWSVYQVIDSPAAKAAKPSEAVLVEAFGRSWIFTVGAPGRDLAGARRMKDVGPLAVEAGPTYRADYLKSTFTPGMKAPLHVHSGPEAFYALSGGSCLETPDGVQKAKGPNHALTVRKGPPMLLMATGREPRQGFALILHDAGAPPTTLIHDWQPKGLCEAAS